MEGTPGFEHRGRWLSEAELLEVAEVVTRCSGLSRNELAHTVCEHLNWVTVSGRHKVTACMSLLERLEAMGRLRLPAKYKQQWLPRRPLEWTERTRCQEVVVGPLRELGPISLSVVRGREGNALFNEFVARYHPLGYKRPFGCVVRYEITCARGVMGVILLSGAAREIEVREDYIGWDIVHRRRNLPFVVNNSRYLLFPWVHVKHLASHVLGQLAQRVRADFDREFGFQPVLLETFVDPARHEGTCYVAAGWQRLGMTKGTGLVRPGKSYETVPRLVFVKPLVGDFREQLCSDQLNGRFSDEWEDEETE